MRSPLSFISALRPCTSLLCLWMAACSSGSPSNTAGTGGGGGTITGTGGTTTSPATFTVDVKLSDAIQTVGIKKWDGLVVALVR